MKIGFLGDLHGNLAAGRYMLWTMHREGVTIVFQVGDFGIYTDNNGMKFASKMNEYAAALGIVLIVVPGNHENWRVINEMTGENRIELAKYRENIFVAPRGWRGEFGGMTFVALGGAPSVDRTWRREYDALSKDKYKANKYWYHEEQITGADVDYTVAGGYADVMIGHDAPHGIDTIERNIKGNPHGFHIADILYAEEGRVLMTEAFRGVAPKFFFHGHYHFPVNEFIQRPGAEYGDETRVCGLDCEFGAKSMAVLDTETKTATFIDGKKALHFYRQEGVPPWPKG